MTSAARGSVLLTALMVVAGCAPKQSAVPADGMTWESMPLMPDFSGWWRWDYEATHDNPLSGLNIELKPEISARLDEYFAAKVAAALEADPNVNPLSAALAGGYDCRPPHFLGINADPHHAFSQSALEFLFTPGRVTIVDENGLIRRVALGQALPADVAESSAGTSVGHWEGRTLVVETTGFDSQWSPADFFGIAKVGKGAHSLERISLEAPDVLKIELELDAPELLAKPFEKTYLFKRAPGHEFVEWSACKPDDRSLDPVTQMDRFDTTPPADLPPPPSD